MLTEHIEEGKSLYNFVNVPSNEILKLSRFASQFHSDQFPPLSHPDTFDGYIYCPSNEIPLYPVVFPAVL